MEGKNPFYENLKKYVNRDIVVAFKSGKGNLSGKLIAVNFTTLNFIIQGKDGRDYIIRDDVSYIAIEKPGDTK